MQPLLKPVESAAKSLWVLLRGRPKVFCIGPNKTGTTSLHRLFLRLGYHAFHSTKWVQASRWYTMRYECFSDAVPDNWRLLAERYPDARFILQVRELDRWLISRLAHIQRRSARGRETLTAFWNDSDETARFWVEQWHDHHAGVLDYFRSQPARLLVVNVCSDPEWERKVSTFLGHEHELRHEPVANRRPTSQSVSALEQRVSALLLTLGIPPEEQANDLFCPSYPGLRQRQWPSTSDELARNWP